MNCNYCGKPLDQPTKGRRKEYCNDACRQAGNRKRQRNADELNRITPQVYVGDNLLHLPRLPDASVDLVAIDPPYNKGKAEWDNLGAAPAYRDWIQLRLVHCQRVLKASGNLFVFGQQPYLHEVMTILLERLHFQRYIVWDKRQGPPVRDHALKITNEDLLWFSKSESPYMSREGAQIERDFENIRRYGGKIFDMKNLGTVWNVPPLIGEGRADLHETQKPVDLMSRIIAIACPADGVVLDCFGGTGTTSVAAMQLGRQSIYMENDPGYAAVARKRFERESNRISLV